MGQRWRPADLLQPNVWTGDPATQIGGDHNNLFASTGYLTAWMRYQLFGDIYARTAFVGSPGEIFTHPGFQGVFSKSLT
jgi:hypothetical protein